MTTLHWTFDPGKEIANSVRRGLGWRAFGRLLAGALWGGVVAGILIAHGRVEILALIF